jgi:hypothetical protein
MCVSLPDYAVPGDGGRMSEVAGLRYSTFVLGEVRKQFFFEKKNQKTFTPWAAACGGRGANIQKFFASFFSKKKSFLP